MTLCHLKVQIGMFIVPTSKDLDQPGHSESVQSLQW